jgi:hypothetical protein
VLLMVALEDHIEEKVVLDVLDPVCLYLFIYVEVKTWTIDLKINVLLVTCITRCITSPATLKTWTTCFGLYVQESFFLHEHDDAKYGR